MDFAEIHRRGKKKILKIKLWLLSGSQQFSGPVHAAHWEGKVRQEKGAVAKTKGSRQDGYCPCSSLLPGLEGCLSCSPTLPHQISSNRQPPRPINGEGQSHLTNNPLYQSMVRGRATRAP